MKLPRNPWDFPVTRDGQGQEISLGEVINRFYESSQTYELAAFFDALQCYAPTVGQLDETAIEAILRLSPSGPAAGHEAVFEAICEAGYDAMQCVVTGGTLVSFAHERWDFDHGVVQCGGKVVEFDHASRTSHVGGIIKRRIRAARSAVTRQNFEAIRAEAFPSLAWGQDTARQLQTFPSEYLGLAFTRLANLDEMVKRWRTSGTAAPDPGSMILRAESELTMQNYGLDRRFRSSTGEMTTYETHVWIDRGNRIHLLLDPANRALEVGYVGPHLRTWKY